MSKGEQIEYRGVVYSPEEFERQFNPRAVIENVDEIIAHRMQLSDDARVGMTCELGVAYGSSARETLDIYPSNAPAAPVLIFLHGGYWRAGSARANGFVATPFIDAGACVFMINYDLCPAVSVSHIVTQIGQALAWIADHAGNYGGDSSRLFLLGHSAGAHLALMAMTDRTGTVPIDAIKGVNLVSGIYDLEPVLSVSVNAEIGLRPSDVEPLSPLRQKPRSNTPIIIAVGLDESTEWVRQSRLYTEHCRAAGQQVVHMEIEHTDHLSTLFEMRKAEHPVTMAVCRQMGLAPG